MKIAVLLLVGVAASGEAQSQKPRPRAVAVSPAFVTAAETAIDESAHVTVLQSASGFKEDMRPARLAMDVLSRTAKTATEKEVALNIAMMNEDLETCQIVGAIHDLEGFGKCLDSVTEHRNAAMRLLGRHKERGVWQDGPPSPIKRTAD